MKNSCVLRTITNSFHIKRKKKKKRPRKFVGTSIFLSDNLLITFKDYYYYSNSNILSSLLWLIFCKFISYYEPVYPQHKHDVFYSLLISIKREHNSTNTIEGGFIFLEMKNFFHFIIFFIFSQRYSSNNYTGPVPMEEA